MRRVRTRDFMVFTYMQFTFEMLFPTIAFYCSDMASLSYWGSGQSKNLKKRVKTLDKSILNHLLHSNLDIQMDHLKKII